MTATTFTPMSGEEVEGIIAENGGVGAWEELTAEEPTERWSFPRFPGADTYGQCDAEGVEHRVNHQITAECEGHTPDPGNMYLSRAGIGNHDTDVETVVAWLEAPRNVVGGVLLLGDPGGGKTSLAQAAFTHAEMEYEVITATPDHTKDSLLTRFMGEGLGEDGTAFMKATMARAAEEGKGLIVDEFLLFVDGVKPLWYPLLDGSHWLPEANIDGSSMAIDPATRVVITANPLVRGASLPEPISSRFAGTTLRIETSASMLRDLGIDESLVQCWETLENQNLWKPQIREMRVADYWLGADPTQAASAFLPEHCPDSQRRQVRDIVVGFLGGNLRADGRLVVS